MATAQRMSMFDRVARGLLLIFFANDIMGGATRYLAVKLGVPLLAYVPELVLAFSLLPMYIAYLASEGVTSTYLTIAGLLTVSATYGVFNLANSAQVAYGLWSLVPFLTGVLVAPGVVRAWSTLWGYALCLWSIAVVGIFINYFYTWPWIGFEFQVGAMPVSASRLWHIDQFDLFRLPGFSEASYFVAPQVLLLALFLRETTPRRLWIPVWVISGPAIILTTSKTFIALFVIFSLFWLFRRRTLLRFLHKVPALAGCFAVVLPFAMLLVNLDWLSSMQSPLSQGLISTFVERMEVGWPEWIRMAAHNGSMLLGRGLGGIGTSQEHFEPGLFSPSDNIAVFAFATFGVFGLLLLVAYARKASRYYGDSPTDRFFLFSACVVLLAGITLSVMDSSLLGLTFGASLRFFQDKGRAGFPATYAGLPKLKSRSGTFC